jgi:hypothetical protein
MLSGKDCYFHLLLGDGDIGVLWCQGAKVLHLHKEFSF